MPHIEVLLCPSCGASLSYDPGSETHLTCQFCGTNFVISEALRIPLSPTSSFVSEPEPVPVQDRPDETPADLDGNLLEEIRALVQFGHKIAAIQAYHNTYKVGLKEAKDAIDAMTIDALIRPQLIQPVTRHASPWVIWIAVIGVLFLAAGVVFLNLVIPRSRSSSNQTIGIQQPTLTPLSAGAALDATQGVEAQITRRAQATSVAQASAERQQQTATAQVESTAKANAGATATAEIQATAQAMIAIQSGWPSHVVDVFMDNQPRWPVGIQQDAFLMVNPEIKDAKYMWTVKPKKGNCYMNLFPLASPVYSDFYAIVDLQFSAGGEGGNYAYGLVFRSVDQDYGFFGIQADGNYRLLVVYNTGIYTFIEAGEPSINTQPGQTNQVAVRAIGDNFIFLINNQVVYGLIEDLAPGEIGLGVDVLSQASAAQVAFTHFEIRAP